MYFSVIENNDWEGETWRFHFPVPKDLAAIGRLRKHLAEDEYTTESHEVPEKLLKDSEVEVLVENDPNHGYMAGHHLCGPLNIDAILALKGEDLMQALYKGQVRKFEQKGLG